MPADAGVDDRGASSLDRLGQCHHLVPGGTIRDQVDHRQPENQNKVRTHRFAAAADNLHREAHAVGVGAAPVVGALVGVGDQELVDQVTLGAHDLDPVVARFAGEHSGADVGLDLLLDARRGPLPRGHGRDRRLDR